MPDPRSARLELWGVAGLVVVGVAGFLIVRQLSPEHQVKARIEEQRELWNAEDLAGLFATLSPKMQAACPLEALTTAVAGLREDVFAFPDVQIENLRIAVDGPRAVVTGSITAGGRTVFTITQSDPAVYIRSGDGWLLDSMDTAHAACSRSQGQSGVPATSATGSIG